MEFCLSAFHRDLEGTPPLCIVAAEHPSTLGLAMPVGGLTVAEAAGCQSITIGLLFITNRTLILFRTTLEPS